MADQSQPEAGIEPTAALPQPSELSVQPVAASAASPVPVSPWLAAVLTFCLALALLVLVPPFQPADEFAHFCRAFEVSEFNFAPVRTANALGDDMPVAFEAVHKRVKVLYFRPDMPFPGAWWAELWHEPVDYARREFVEFRNTAIYPAVLYAPSVPFIWLGRLLGLPTIGLLYLARFGNALAYAALVFAIFRWLRMQHFAWLIFVTLPMMVTAGASVNADFVTVAAATGCLSYAIYLRSGPGVPLTRSELGLLAVWAALLACSKFVYLPILGVAFLLIPARRFANARHRWLTLGGIGGAALLLCVVITQHARSIFLTVDPNTVDPTLQMQRILAQPIEFVVLLVRSIVSYQVSLAVTLVGSLGHQDTLLPVYVYVGSLFALLFFALVAPAVPGSMSLPGGRMRLTAVVTGLGVVGLLGVVLYLSWTPVGAPEVRGLIGRYLLPLVPLAFIGLANGHWLDRNPLQTRVMALAWIVIAWAGTFWAVYQRYWV